MSGVLEKLVTLGNTLLSSYEAIVQGFKDMLLLPVKIAESLKDAFQDLLSYLFIPDEDLIDKNIAMLREQFSLIDSLAGYGDHILNALGGMSGSTPPSFTVDLSKKGGVFSWGTGKVVIDFSWYAPYKPLVDNIVAGIIWISWTWHMYKRIPEFVHGQGMTTDKIVDVIERNR